MIRLIAIGFLTGLISFGLVRLSGLQGDLVFTAEGYRAGTSAGVAAGLIALFAGLCAVVMQLSWYGLTASGVLGRRLNPHRWQRGSEAVSRGFIAAGIGDVRNARLQANRSHELIGSQPLVLLLSAQTASLEGDALAQTRAWQALASRPDTAGLGLRGLFVQAMRRGDTVEATDLALRAHALKPKAPWGARALIELKARQHKWSEAKTLLDEVRNDGLTDVELVRRYETVLLTAEALDAERSGESERALSGAIDALSMSPGFPPAAALAGRLLLKSGRPWRAQDVLATAWTQNPNPMLAQAYAAMRANESKEIRARHLIDLARLNRDHFESRLLQAEQAIARCDCAEARRVLAPFTRGSATTRLCAFMAEIEMVEDHDLWGAHAWRRLAAHAHPDSDWRCCHCSAANVDWQAVCANCGAFDALEWPALPADAAVRQTHPPCLGNVLCGPPWLASADSFDRRRSRAYAMQDSARLWQTRLNGREMRFGRLAADDLRPERCGFDGNPV